MVTCQGWSTQLKLLAAVLALVTAPISSDAQPAAGKVARVGLLGVTSAAGYARQIAAMRQGFLDLGYVEGRNLIIEYRWADGQYDRLPALAAELIRLQPDVILTSGQGIRALKGATTTIPIVMAVGGDAVADGIVASLARPGGNVTGSVAFSPELAAKRLELLKGAVPTLAKVAVLRNPANRGSGADFELVKKTATALQVEVFEAPARSPQEFDDAFALMLRRRADGVVTLGDSMLVANMRRLGEMSAAKRLPGAGSDEYAEGGGLLAYGVNFPELWRRAPYFVDKILRGGNPATIPVEQPARFEFIINGKAAKALGLTIPQPLLLRADHVIQ